MKVGKKIKQLRELQNFTQQYMADQLSMSLSGYGKIERDETDVTLNKMNQIAKILDTDLNTILSFDKNQVFNLYNNKNANAIVSYQQVVTGEELSKKIIEIEEMLKAIKIKLNL